MKLVGRHPFPNTSDDPSVAVSNGARELNPPRGQRQEVNRGRLSFPAPKHVEFLENVHSQKETRPAPRANDGARVLAMLPRAAEEYRREIALGRHGDAAAALKIRVKLRELLGDIRLEPAEDGSFWQPTRCSREALIRAGVNNWSGREDLNLRHLPSRTQVLPTCT